MTYSTIIRKKKLCACGCGREGFIWAKGMLKDCHTRINGVSKIRKVSEKQAEKISENKPYFLQQIANNIKRFDVATCENCLLPIKNVVTRNVHHIISGGANEALYTDPLNSFILGLGTPGQCDCGVKFDTSTKQSELVIWKERRRRRLILMQKFALMKGKEIENSQTFNH